MEKIIKYSLWRRIGYARRNNWFLKTFPYIPTNQDIHIHNCWKDIKRKK